METELGKRKEQGEVTGYAKMVGKIKTICVCFVKIIYYFNDIIFYCCPKA